MTYTTTTTDSAATQSLARKLAAHLQGGDVIELISDLGGGKTTFTQGLAAGLGYVGPVTSPTFTLSQIYSLPHSLELHHYDLYRLNEAGILNFELGEDVASPSVITVIEWGDIVHDVLPPNRLRVQFTMTSETARTIEVSGSGRRAAIIIESLK